jgi:TRAP-type C4-dicarboxylate transport system permease small subunit
MNTVRHLLATVLRWLCAASLLALLVIVLLGILSKKTPLFNLSWTSESAELLLSWTVMLGAALAYLENAHIGVDILTSKLTPFARRAAAVFVALVVFLFAAGVMTWGGWQLFSQRYQMGQTMSSLPFLRAWFYFSLPISGVLISLFALDNLRLALGGKPAEPKPREDPS